MTVTLGQFVVGVLTTFLGTLIGVVVFALKVAMRDRPEGVRVTSFGQTLHLLVVRKGNRSDSLMMDPEQAVGLARDLTRHVNVVSRNRSRATRFHVASLNVTRRPKRRWRDRAVDS